MWGNIQKMEHIFGSGRPWNPAQLQSWQMSWFRAHQLMAQLIPFTHLYYLLHIGKLIKLHFGCPHLMFIWKLLCKPPAIQSPPFKLHLDYNFLYLLSCVVLSSGLAATVPSQACACMLKVGRSQNRVKPPNILYSRWKYQFSMWL